MALKVTLSFAVANRSAMDLVLPSEWQGATELFRSIRQIRLLSSGSAIHDSNKPSRRRISFEAGKPVRLEYWFQPEKQSPQPNLGFRPIVNSDYFVLTGRNFLVCPDLPEHDPVSVSVEWANFPSSWTLADSLGAQDRCQKGSTLLKLSNGLFIGGDFRLRTSSAAVPQLYLAVRGQWQFDDAYLAELASKVIADERRFWNDRSLPPILLF